MVFLYLFLGLVVLISLIPLYLYVTEYKPSGEENAIKYRNNRHQKFNDTFTITSFNLGFCGKDRTQDFYIEGGHTAGAKTRETRFDNLIALTSDIKALESDFYLMQEVDTHGSRTSDINQVEHIASELSNYNFFFAYNFIAKWMQIPLLHPLGNVNSGLLVASEHTFLSSKRIQLETMNTLPKRLFSPKECMVISRFEIPPFELILINVYLMPYTPIDTIRLHQLETIMNHAAMLYDPLKNYVIVAGDFHYQLDGKSTPEHPPFPTDKVPEGFTLVYDHDNASVRSMNHPYIKDMNYEYIVDGFIVSKNLHHTKIKTVDLGFEHANHNPVTLEIEIK